MKALSLIQPYATLIMLGYKQYETRSWSTKHRGTLAIHASAGKPAWARKVCQENMHIRQVLSAHGLTFDTLPRAAVLGICQVNHMLKICAPSAAESEHEIEAGDLRPVEVACGDYTPGRWAWDLDKVLELPTPIPQKGALSIWELPTEVEEAIKAQSQAVSDASWEVLKSICNAANEGDYAALTVQTTQHLPKLDHNHFEAVLEATELTPEFIGTHRGFLTSVSGEIARRDVKLYSFRSGIRLEVLRTHLTEAQV
ncbi:hypothetical protein [Hymenobacter algoricola]|uniref:ASCH domain-containing protein n=1 Tax=Hymenobacter algoricola TaxID=486267 RepID=A0ABP7NBK4_9BACT